MDIREDPCPNVQNATLAPDRSAFDMSSMGSTTWTWTRDGSRALRSLSSRRERRITLLHCVSARRDLRTCCPTEPEPPKTAAMYFLDCNIAFVFMLLRRFYVRR